MRSAIPGSPSSTTFGRMLFLVRVSLMRKRICIVTPGYIASTPRVGSRFTLRLPRREPVERRERRAAAGE